MPPRREQQRAPAHRFAPTSLQQAELDCESIGWKTTRVTKTKMG